MPETASIVDPYPAFNFKVEIEGVNEAHFTQCSPIGARVETIAYRSGGTGSRVRKLPGRVDYSNVVLSYGLTESVALWEWFQTVVTGQIQRKNISIVLLDNNGVDEARRWNLFEAWPTQWNGASLEAMGNSIAIESLEIAFEHMEVS